MKVAAIIVGALVALFGGGCIALAGGNSHPVVFFLGWGPLLFGGSLIIFVVGQERGKELPLVVQILTVILWLLVIAAFIFISSIWNTRLI